MKLHRLLAEQKFKATVAKQGHDGFVIPAGTDINGFIGNTFGQPEICVLVKGRFRTVP